MKRVLRGGCLKLPGQGHDGVTDVWLDGERVTGIGSPPEIAAQDYQELEIGGHWLLPAATDLKADVAQHTAIELAAAAASGISLLVCAPSRHNPLDNPALVEHLLREGAGAACGVLPLGALTRGLAGRQLTDYASLRSAGCVGLSNGDLPVADSAVLRNAMRYAASLDLPVFLQPIDPALGGGCAHEGPIATRMGLPAIPSVAEVAGLARDLELVADTGARTHFTRLSCARSVDLIRTAIDQGLPVSADVAMAHLFLTEHDLSGFNALCHLQPPLRSTTDRQALLQGVADGVISAICSDHRPLPADSKLAPFAATEPGLSGLETLLALGMRLVDDGALDLPRLLLALRSGPAAVLGQPAFSIGVGQTVSLALWDPDEVWRPGQQTWQSRGSCSPFSNWELKGRARGLI